MDLSAWVVYTFITALVMAASVVHYHWREPRGRGRAGLGIMRGAALGVVILLLFDPTVPTGMEPPVVVLVDASLSMSLPGETGETRWDRARRVVDSLDTDRVHLFGTPELRAVSDVGTVEPIATGSRLAPALRAVVESGAGRVVVVTDGAIEDAGEVRRTVAGAGVPIEVIPVGDDTRLNLALAAVEAPAWLEAGEEATVRVEIARVGGAGGGPADSVMVAVSRDGRELARVRVQVPPAGRRSSAELRFRPEPDADGLTRLDFRVAPGGAAADDDERSVYVRIAEEPAEVALLSLRPDQEPRFLLPVLERALGVPVRGWLGLTGGRFIRLGRGTEAGVVTASDAVRRAVSDAGVVVLHGFDDSAPAWIRDVAAGSERILVFPSDPPPPLPVAMGPRRTGDWYVSADIPASPVAPLLAGVDMESVPPLAALRAADLPDPYWTPLTARLGRQGAAYPVVAVGVESGRRVAIALGDGYWRWAFSGSTGRDLYERLWAALGGWLLEDLEGLDREAIRPADRVVARGEAIAWMVTAATDSVAITLIRDTAAGPAAGAGPDADAPAMDTVVVVEAGRSVTAPLPPGHYRYAAGTSAGGVVEGGLTVESYSSELADAATALDAAVDGAAPGGRPVEGRPLHTTPWPYALVVLLLCGEWVLRRRWGLR